MCQTESSPMLVINDFAWPSHEQTFCIKELCLQKDVNNEGGGQCLPQDCSRLAFSKRPKNHTESQSSVSQEMWTMNMQSRIFPSVTDKLPFEDNLPSKTFILTQRDLSPRTPEHSICNVPDKWPSQDHLLTKTIILILSSVSLQIWTENMQKLPHCDWWIAFSRPSSE